MELNLEGIQGVGVEGTVPVKFLTGSAGSGKTYAIREQIAKDPRFAVLAATTGIAAVNLGAITLNSLLKYFDTRSLEEAFFNGWLVRILGKLAMDGYKWLAIDEISMMAGEQLDILYQAMKQLNEVRAMSGEAPLGLLLTGDFCQLPPIKSKWAFEADCWPFFEAQTERLTKIWRQSDAKFLEAVNHIRSGRGMVGATMLSQMGVEFVKHADTAFAGTTIIAKNDAVDNFNWLCHSKLPGVPATVQSVRWMGRGRQLPSEWKHIPSQLKLKPKAYVMIINNDTPKFTYVNGDCGHITGYDSSSQTFGVRLVRNQEEVEIGAITRKVTQHEPPDEVLLAHPEMGEDELRKLPFEPGVPYWDVNQGRRGMWVTGAITFNPLNLAYASTVHKCQGLTLDRVQLDLNQHFMTAPSMVYVAISRCKTPQGLRIIGSPALLGSRVKVDPAVLKWL